MPEGETKNHQEDPPGDGRAELVEWRRRSDELVRRQRDAIQRLSC